MITLFLKKLTERLKGLKAWKEVLDRFNGRRFPIEIEGPEGMYIALLIGMLFGLRKQPVLIAVPTEKEANDLVADLKQVTDDVELFPWSGMSAYSISGPSAEITGEQNRILGRLAHDEATIVVAPLRSLLAALPPPAELRTRELSVSRGEESDPRRLGELLVELGYLRVPRVSVHGEFAQRGEVVDVFPVGDEYPFRIVYDFEQVSRITRFDAVTQSSRQPVDTARIRPITRGAWSEERIGALETLIRSMRYPEADDTLASLARGEPVPYEHLLFAASFERVSTVLDYLGDSGLLVLVHEEHLASGHESLVKEYNQRYAQARGEKLGFIPQPARILADFDSVRRSDRKIISFPAIKSGHFESSRVRFPYEGPHSYFGNVEYLRSELGRIAESGYEIVVCSDSEAQKLRIEHMLAGEQVSVAHASISHGFSIPELKVAIIQEDEIFGRRKRRPRSVGVTKSAAIDTFVELNPGDLVVHINYGIGRFKGIERIKALGTERDYIQIEYSGEETIFVPIEQVNLVQRYIGHEGGAIRLDKIGGKGWESRKSKVKRSVEDLAEMLLALYSKRKAAVGFAYPRDTDWQLEFEADFEYEETPDQLRCIEEVKVDMEKPLPMDRLVCGDVGYGKTEVAMRAAFKAVTGGRQVAYLAPTTILVEQHYDCFTERFASYPVRIGMLSRFVAKAEQKKVVDRLAKGEIDILIGTHRLLQKDVHFKNLGLIVVDEEQRFGVKDKERLKEWKTNVDCLTLTATPIPRTLHMSLLKIRDMSILTTPPYNRRPIETHIREFDELVVSEAIRNEMRREGQVFFLHNRVETLIQVQNFINRLVPEALIEIAHGQMNADELEEIMHRFVHGAFHVLVSTTIIENGIDIPNVNTIIIDRADMYGVAQLYQLRGRVGRSDRLAYAYLLYPEERALTEIAMKRLQIISDHTELGSGFKVALKDLEVRGAGNLLGRQQHGDILSVGFDMYVRLLDQAIAELEKDDGKRELPEEVFLELDYSGFIPNEYIEEPLEKMEIYKKIASITAEGELEALLAELEDRFGAIPDEVHSLLALAEIRILCRKLHIASLRERSGVIRVEFGRIADISIDRVIRLIRESKGTIRPDPRQPNVLSLEVEGIGLEQKSEYLRERLEALV
jgi:transcription-repair coupling factor (superfamily II helicase)